MNGYFADWDYDGTLDRIHQALYVKCREQAECAPSPTAAIIDSQSVKSPEKCYGAGGEGQAPSTLPSM